MTRGVPFTLTVPALPSSAARTPWNYPSGLTDFPARMNPGQLAANTLFGLRTAIAMITRTPVVRFARKRGAMGIRNPSVTLARYVDAAALVLTASVFGLEYEFPAPPKVNLVGAFVSEAALGSAGDPDLSRWLDEHDSVVYLGFGTLMRLSRDQIGALLGAIDRLGPGHRFLWKLPAEQQKLLPADSELPGNLRVENWIPSQLDVLAHPHVRAFVTHGGSNGFHESMYFGKPVLVVPAWFDCYAIAARATHSGVGLAVGDPNDLTSGELAGLLDRLLTDATFTARAAYWSARVRGAGGTARAADLILELGSPSG
ncbi:glycosyltransferase [Amycolatopsis samaneae]|uniref:Glycosyltransferase n=1 Tax=Amycolatopsis samaneae TaxID=664691 RepID=A0ABW5GWC0_9PSEU